MIRPLIIQKEQNSSFPLKKIKFVITIQKKNRGK